MFLRYVHNFRAVAILFIVAGHAAFTLGTAAEPRTMDFLADLLDYGTILFLFIAGFLFEHLSRSFDYRRYLRRKFLNVIVPYLLTSIPAIIYTVLATDGGHSAAYRGAAMLVTGVGTPDYAVWFVPMIALFYLAAPLFIQLVRRPRLYVVAIPLLAFSVLAHRPPEVQTPAIALYFLPIYIIGMWASHERTRLEPLLRSAWPWLLAVFIGSVIVRFLFSRWHGGEYSSGLFSGEFGLIDWMMLMKLVLAFALIGMMQQFDGRLGDRLTFIGDISFTIFFVHCYLLFLFLHGYIAVFGAVPQGNVASWFALTVGVVGVTMAGTAAAKKALGRRSRFLIGS